MASKPFPAPDITILNSMAGREFEAALDRHLAWGITRLDLKDFIFGKPVVELSDREVEAASRMIAERKLSVYALSTSLFAQDVEAGETAFRQGHFGRIARVLEIAAAFAPTFIRLIAASTERRRSVADGIRYAAAEAPWLFELYDEAIDRIAGEAHRMQSTLKGLDGRCGRSWYTQASTPCGRLRRTTFKSFGKGMRSRSSSSASRRTIRAR